MRSNAAGHDQSQFPATFVCGVCSQNPRQFKATPLKYRRPENLFEPQQDQRDIDIMTTLIGEVRARTVASSHARYFYFYMALSCMAVAFLGFAPAQASSSDTAIAMAQTARARAARLAPAGADLVGLGATAALVSDRPRRGEHRFHIAFANSPGPNSTGAHCTCVLAKGRRDEDRDERQDGGAHPSRGHGAAAAARSGISPAASRGVGRSAPRSGDAWRRAARSSAPSTD